MQNPPKFSKGTYVTAGGLALAVIAFAAFAYIWELGSNDTPPAETVTAPAVTSQIPGGTVPSAPASTIPREPMPEPLGIVVSVPVSTQSPATSPPGLAEEPDIPGFPTEASSTPAAAPPETLQPPLCENLVEWAKASWGSEILSSEDTDPVIVGASSMNLDEEYLSASEGFCHKTFTMKDGDKVWDDVFTICGDGQNFAYSSDADSCIRRVRALTSPTISQAREQFIAVLTLSANCSPEEQEPETGSPACHYEADRNECLERQQFAAEIAFNPRPHWSPEEIAEHLAEEDLLTEILCRHACIHREPWLKLHNTRQDGLFESCNRGEHPPPAELANLPSGPWHEHEYINFCSSSIGCLGHYLLHVFCRDEHIVRQPAEWQDSGTWGDVCSRECDSDVTGRTSHYVSGSYAVAYSLGGLACDSLVLDLCSGEREPLEHVKEGKLAPERIANLQITDRQSSCWNVCNRGVYTRTHEYEPGYERCYPLVRERYG